MTFSLKCPLHAFLLGGVIVGSLTAIGALHAYIYKKKEILRIDVDKRFTDIVKVGNMIYMSGQLGEGETIEQQTKNVLETIDAVLKKAGSDKTRILELTIWLSDMNRDYDGMNKVYDTWIVPGHPPCRACIEAKLFSPKHFIEVRAVALAA